MAAAIIIVRITSTPRIPALHCQWYPVLDTGMFLNYLADKQYLLVPSIFNNAAESNNNSIVP
jgi:hypothetical protein